MLLRISSLQQFRPKFTGYARRSLETVAVQLDYYMSSQFAGIASALTNNLYEKRGLRLEFLPICPVGLELERVRSNAGSTQQITLGSVEMNIFVPLLYSNPELKVKAVAAMFRRSPLASASLASCEPKQSRTVGAHQDTGELIQRILKHDESTRYRVVASPRATKATDLTYREMAVIQTYTMTELLTLERQLGMDSVLASSLEGLYGAKLGYSQMLFAPDEQLSEYDQREIIRDFLKASFDGWEIAIRDTKAAAESVNEVRKMLGLDKELSDHWGLSSGTVEMDYQMSSVEMCCDFAKETFQGDRYGSLNASRFKEARDWLLNGQSVDDSFGIDTTIWQQSSQLLAGNELAREILQDAKEAAEGFASTNGRKPSLAIVTVGDLPRYAHGARRVELYSNKVNSWFQKIEVGKANAFDVEEIQLPSSTTTDELLSELYALAKVDGIQLMWPLPSHIDSFKVHDAIDVLQDVDGAHYMRQAELDPLQSQNNPIPPVAPAAVLGLMKAYDIDLRNKHAVVIGRSHIVGSPLTRMLRDQNTSVTVVHSGVAPDKLQELVSFADILIPCAGQPGIVNSEWIKPGATVINVGTTFSQEKDCLVSDIDGNIEHFAGKFSPVPGGVGPLSVAYLFKHTIEAAWKREAVVGNIKKEWTRSPGCLARKFHFENYDKALLFTQKVNEMSRCLDHHATMRFKHECVDGVGVELEFFSYEANKVTEKDYLAARKVNEIYEGEQIRMLDYTYDLKMESIATKPAEPRGSSRLLRVDEDGNVLYFDRFDECILELAKDSTIVFNESKVADARVYVRPDGSSSSIEMMILDIGELISAPATGLQLSVMLRNPKVQVGQIFNSEKSDSCSFRVVDVVGPWIEDEHSQGKGTECIVECEAASEEASLDELLKKIGSVPIPPYLNREAEDDDEKAYNNVYSKESGSVAAPTAGLHFTDTILRKLGQENLVYLSLHVGAGTFRPVAVENARDHKMHSESFRVQVGELRRIVHSLESGKRLIVVGTTSCRTLETMYWCGVKGLLGQTENGDLTLEQEEWKLLEQSTKGIDAVTALTKIAEGKENGDIIVGRTSMMITPNSYKMRVVNDLITNFHAPDSTLMLLVSAFLGSGEKIRKVYEDAQEKGYRFLSYGDVCFFSKPKS